MSVPFVVAVVLVHAVIALHVFAPLVLSPRRCERGTIFVEYLLIVAFFTLPLMVALYSIGLPLLRFSRYGEMVLAGPVP